MLESDSSTLGLELMSNRTDGCCVCVVWKRLCVSIESLDMPVCGIALRKCVEFSSTQFGFGPDVVWNIDLQQGHMPVNILYV